MKLFRQERYFQNLRVQGTRVISYTTEVAEIDHPNDQVIRLGYWSATTSKHINYVASQLEYKVVDVHDVEMDDDIENTPKRKPAKDKIIIEYGVNDD